MWMKMQNNPANSTTTAPTTIRVAFRKSSSACDRVGVCILCLCDQNNHPEISYLSGVNLSASMLSFIQNWENLGLALQDKTICHSSDKMSVVDSDWPSSVDCWFCVTVVLYIVHIGEAGIFCQNTEIQQAVIDGEKYPATTENKTLKNAVFCQIYVKIDLTKCVKWLKLDTKSKFKLFVSKCKLYLELLNSIHLEYWLMYW